MNQIWLAKSASIEPKTDRLKKVGSGSGKHHMSSRMSSARGLAQHAQTVEDVVGVLLLQQLNRAVDFLPGLRS